MKKVFLTTRAKKDEKLVNLCAFFTGKMFLSENFIDQVLLGSFLRLKNVVNKLTNF
jgi:hypothetical protein